MPSSSSFITVKRCGPLSRRCPATLQEQFVSSYRLPALGSTIVLLLEGHHALLEGHHTYHPSDFKTAPGRAPTLCGVGAREGKFGECAAGRGLCPHTVADQDTSRRNSYLQEPGRTLRWVATALSGLAAHTRSRRDLDSNPSRDRAEITSRRRPFQKGVIATLYARGHLRP